MRKNKKQRNNKHKYYPDVITYYANQKNQSYYNSLLGVASTQDIHDIAIEVFGKTYYIPFEDIAN